MTIQRIVSRWDENKVLFECELPEGILSGLAMRHALEKAVEAGADLAGAYLAGAYLADAYLAGANLADADLADADLAGAYLAGANLAGAYLADADLADADLADADLAGADLAGANLDIPPATPEQSIENLDKVRAIILDNRERLRMDHWHQTEEWKERTCAEETLCHTTHCLAGWLQVCSTDPKVRDLSPSVAGMVMAPISSKMFYRGGAEVLSWLEDRKYVGEIAESERRRAERAKA